MIRLQRFGHRDSAYDRPNEPWICGWAAIGQPCRVGPDRRGRCQATYECRPLRTGDRWVCTRPATAGGSCVEGPLPNGMCCRAVPRCVPVRSQRSRRGQIAVATFVALLGLFAVLLGGGSAAWLVSPGPLSVRHGGIRQCSGCHIRFAAGPVGWLHAAFADAPIPAMAQPCLVCHKLGRHPLSAHGLDGATLVSLGQGLLAMSAASNGAAKPDPVSPTPVAFALPQVARGDVACSACHREHRGGAAPLSAVHSAMCQTCHVMHFASLAQGHPEFVGYPFHRRMRIIFDHAKHFDQYFAQSSKALVPSGCGGCHTLGPARNAMLVKPFATACAGCHLDDIKEREGAEVQGVAVLGVPALDLQTLRAHNAAIGDWPAEADGDLSTFLRFLLAQRPGTGKDLATLGTTSLGDLSHADDAQIAAAARIAWAIKELLLDVSVKGPTVLVTGAAQNGGHAVDAAALIGGLPADAIRVADRTWFPALAHEVALHRAGKPVPMKAPQTPPQPSSAATPPAPQGPIAGTANGSILGGGGILGAAPAPKPSADHGSILGGGGILGAAPAPKPSAAGAAPTPATPQPPAPIGSEAWTDLGGGWYRQDYFLYYRPTGHDDRFLRAWLNLTGSEAGAANGTARRLFEKLANPGAPGACGKCHSVDDGAAGARVVNWLPFQPNPARRGFTKFSHEAHLTLFGSEGCKTCHQFTATADFSTTYKRGDPFVFAASFKPISRQLCATCHVVGHASAACVTCHNYHIDDIREAVAAMTTPDEESTPAGGLKQASRSQPPTAARPP